jgi:hypothetical protein
MSKTDKVTACMHTESSSAKSLTTGVLTNAAMLLVRRRKTFLCYMLTVFILRSRLSCECFDQHIVCWISMYPICIFHHHP